LPLKYNTAISLSVEVFNLYGVSALGEGHCVGLLHSHALQIVIVDDNLVIKVAENTKLETMIQKTRELALTVLIRHRW
jgi:hypothetical protein